MSMNPLLIALEIAYLVQRRESPWLSGRGMPSGECDWSLLVVLLLILFVVGVFHDTDLINMFHQFIYVLI